jgi:hypothetical protein
MEIAVSAITMAELTAAGRKARGRRGRAPVILA